MALAGTEIKRALDSQVWKAWRDGEPIGAADLNIGPVSVDASLGRKISRVTVASGWRYIDLREPASMHVYDVEMDAGGFTLLPGFHYLGHVAESFDCEAQIPLGYYFTTIDGRSTPARAAGLCVHATAGAGEYAWGGQHAQFTLELSVRLPLLVRPGQLLSQIYFKKIECTDAPERYSGAYQTQSGPRPAELGEHRF